MLHDSSTWADRLAVMQRDNLLHHILKSWELPSFSSRRQPAAAFYHSRLRKLQLHCRFSLCLLRASELPCQPATKPAR